MRLTLVNVGVDRGKVAKAALETAQAEAPHAALAARPCQAAALRDAANVDAVAFLAAVLTGSVKLKVSGARGRPGPRCLQSQR